MASGGAADPQSWNRYAYVEGDPVNYYDPDGFIKVKPPPEGPQLGGPIFSTTDCTNPILRALRPDVCDNEVGAQPRRNPDGLRRPGGGGKEKKPKPPIARSRLGIECNDDVILAMSVAWMQSVNGTTGVEATFRVDKVDDSTDAYSIVPQPYTNEQSKQGITIIPGVTSAVFHVHPKGKDPKPSSGDIEGADKYGYLIFTMSYDGLWVYDPKADNPEPVKLRNDLDWLEPCQ